MNKQNYNPSVQDLMKGLEIVELEERLEMVHLSAVEAEATVRCDSGGGDAPAEPAETISDGGAQR